jgi:broad specificity phosphatase PhoE
VFPDKTSSAGSRYRYTKQAVLARAQSSLAELYERPEKAILVVSHSAFLRLGVTGYWFFNADYRIFDYEDKKTASDPCQLRQWDSTKKGALGISLEDPVPIGDGLPEE